MAIDSLVLLLDRENESVRCAAAMALGNIEDPRTRRALRKAYDDPSAWVREVAKKALENTKEKRT